MGIQAPAKVKFALIYEAIQHDDNVLSISFMCKIAGVSRSGFYAWMKAAPARQKRESRDQADFVLVLDKLYPVDWTPVFLTTDLFRV